MGLTWPPSRGVYIAIALTPVVVPAVFLACFSRHAARHTKSSSGVRKPRKNQDSSDQESKGLDEAITVWKPASLPDDVRPDDADWVLAYERVVSNPVAVDDLVLPPAETLGSLPSPLLRTYVAAAQKVFSATPQAALIRSLVDPETKRSFDTDWIDNLAFNKGDLVNGAYRVSYHGQGENPGAERVELTIEAPPSYKGPVPNGLILAECVLVEGGLQEEKDDVSDKTASPKDHVVFVNETWMWRREEEKLTLVESMVGGWMHSLMASWLVMRGIREVKKI